VKPKEPPKLTNDAKIVVAVSGGSDSMAVLHAMTDARGGKGPKNLEAVTVDHGLRDGSADEAARVAKFCAELNVKHTTLTWGGWNGEGNLQDAARRARYKLIADWARENNIEGVVLGHTKDDLAETFLMQVSRKAGLDGLTSLREEVEMHGVWFHRPFLGARRSELQEQLRSQGVEWIDDPSNEDEAFARVRIRNALETLEDAGISADAIEGVVSNLRSARDSLRLLFFHYAEQLVREENGNLILAVRNYMGMPPEFRRMFLMHGTHWVAGGDYPPRMSALKKLPEFVPDRLVPFTFGGCLILNFASMPIDTPSIAQGPAGAEMRITREYERVSKLETPFDELWDGRWRVEGPSNESLRIRALGEAVNQCPDWRDTGIPRQSLLASPSVWHENTLISAPLAGYSNGFTAKATGRGNFIEFLLSR
jgi:tRNA(Ile)-lysidine synthase